MDLVFLLKWVKSVIGCMLFIFHLSDSYIGNYSTKIYFYLEIIKKTHIFHFRTRMLQLPKQ